MIDKKRRGCLALTPLFDIMEGIDRTVSAQHAQLVQYFPEKSMA